MTSSKVILWVVVIVCTLLCGCFASPGYGGYGGFGGFRGGLGGYGHGGYGGYGLARVNYYRTPYSFGYSVGQVHPKIYGFGAFGIGKLHGIGGFGLGFGRGHGGFGGFYG